MWELHRHPPLTFIVGAAPPVSPSRNDSTPGIGLGAVANADVPAHEGKDIPSLTSFMCSDKVFLIFRRFDNLAVRNLLFLQAELAQLERRLEQLDGQDRQSGDPERVKHFRS